MVASHGAPTGDLAHNPGMCPDWGDQTGDPLVCNLHSVHGATPARAYKTVFNVIATKVGNWYHQPCWSALLVGVSLTEGPFAHLS